MSKDRSRTKFVGISVGTALTVLLNGTLLPTNALAGGEVSSQNNKPSQKRPQPKQASAVYNRVRQIFVEQLGVKKEKVTLQARVVEDLGADSLDCVELVMALEEEFDIAIPDEQAEKLKRVGQVVNYVTTRLKKTKEVKKPTPGQVRKGKTGRNP
jgi:acyl carrier protein